MESKCGIVQHPVKFSGRQAAGEPECKLMSAEEGTSAEEELTIPEHLQALFAESCQLLQEGQQKSLVRLLNTYQDVFSQGEHDVGLTREITHDIPVFPGTVPIKQPPHRLGPEKEDEVKRQVDGLLEKGLIEPASGAWSSPVVLVRKKDGTWRFCVDYRKLNAVTQYDAYPLPRIDESLDALSGSHYFSTLDLVSGYWQVPLSEDAKEKSAFTTRYGLWRWKVLPFGLTSAPATFQRLMEKVLHGLHWRTLLLYLDDIIVISPDFDSHLERLEEVLKRLRGANLKLKPSKCELFKDKVRYLGHVVSSHGVSTDPEKVEAVRSWKPPTSVKDLQSFLGLAGYYRQYISDFSTVAKPLSRLTSKETEWEWTPECEEAFEMLKRRLMEAPVLGYPDPALPYILDTDASAVGVGAVLSQIQEGKERVIGYYSKTLSPPERNYCVTRRELLAVVKAVGHFRPYLYGRPFKLRTDHASLLWLCRRKEPSHQVARWLEILSEFRYQVEHRQGIKHGNADGLSRRCIDCRQCRHIEERDGGPTHEELTRLAPVQITEAGIDLSQLWTAQASGPGAVAEIYRHVKVGVEPTEEELEEADPEFKRLAKLQSSMRLDRHGVLQVCLAFNNKSRWCSVCPPLWRQGVIQETHLLAHAGVQKTLKRVQLNWYWPGMTAEIRRYVGQCEICQRSKTGGLQPVQGRRRLHAGRPWQKLAVDLVGPLPPTARGNKWVLVLSDHFTKWQDAFALPDATAPTVASILEERVFCYFGLPEQLHSDQGAQFEGELMIELCDLWGIKKTRTSPYHPQGNGVVERGNRTLGDALRTLLLSRSQEDWDLLLPQIMRTFRATPHSGTGETANGLMLGREVRLPDQLMCPTPYEEPAERSQYAIELCEKLRQVHEIQRERQKDIRQMDSEEPLLFKPGDFVWLENRRRRKGVNPKLQAKFIGPYEVLQSFDNHTYRIGRQGQESIQNERRLKRYTRATQPAGRAPVELEPRRGPNMKGARQGVRRPVEEVPVLPRRVVQPREELRWSPREPSPGPGPLPVGPSRSTTRPQEDPGPTLERPETPIREVEKDLEQPDREPRSDVQRKNSARPKEGGPTGPTSPIGRPKRPTRPPPYLKDFELYRMEARGVETKGKSLENLSGTPEQTPAKLQAAGASTVKDLTLANQKPDSSWSRDPVEGKLHQLQKDLRAVQLCLDELCINSSDNYLISSTMGSNSKDRNNSNQEGKKGKSSRREAEDSRAASRQIENEEEVIENQDGRQEEAGKPDSLNFDIFAESGLTQEEENFLDELLCEGNKPTVEKSVESSCCDNGTTSAELNEAVHDDQLNTPSQAKVHNLPSGTKVDDNKRYDFPWIRRKSRADPHPAGPPCSSGTMQADQGRPGPAPTPPLSKIVAYKEVTCSSDSRSVAGTSKELPAPVCLDKGQVPTPPRPGGPGPTSSDDKGPRDGPVGGGEVTKKKKAKRRDHSDSRKQSVAKVAGGSRSYRDVLVGPKPTRTSQPEAKSISCIVGNELEDGEVALDYEADTDVEISDDRESREREDQRRRELRVELSRVKHRPPRTVWICDGTRMALTRAMVGPDRTECRLCNYKGTTKRLRVHVRQHFMRQFCRCGTHSISRDTMLIHKSKNEGRPGHGDIHEVDRATYREFGESMGWTNPPYFGECTPTLGGGPPVPPVRDARERLLVKGLRLEPPAKREARVRESRVEVRRHHDGEGASHSSKKRPSHTITRPPSPDRKKRCQESRTKSPSVGPASQSESNPSESTPSTEAPSPSQAAADVSESVEVAAGQSVEVTVSAREESRPVVSRGARTELLAGAALLRQQAAQYRVQARMAEMQARMADEQAERMEEMARRSSEGEGKDQE